MLAAIYFSALFENLVFLAPIVLLLLMPVGFIASAWVTNSVIDIFRKDKDEDVTASERLGTFALLTALFGTYCYFVFHLAQ